MTDYKTSTSPPLRAGDEVTGQVEIRVNDKTVNVRGIRVEIKGFAESHWITTSRDKHGRTTTHHHGSKKTLVEHNVTIAGQGKDGKGEELHLVRDQLLTVPFTIRIPPQQDLPASYEQMSRNGVYYSLRAYADVPWASDPEVTQPMKLVSVARPPPAWNCVAAAPHVMQEEHILPSFCCFGQAGRARVVLGMTRGSVLPAGGEPVQIPLRIGAAVTGNFRPTHMSVSLHQRVVRRGFGESRTSTQVMREEAVAAAACVTQGADPKGGFPDVTLTDVIMTLPGLRVPSILTDPYEVSYRMQVRLVLERQGCCTPALTASVPVWVTVPQAPLSGREPVGAGALGVALATSDDPSVPAAAGAGAGGQGKVLVEGGAAAGSPALSPLLVLAAVPA